SILYGRNMQGFDGYTMPHTERLPDDNALDSFNTRLVEEWTKQVKGISTQDQLSSAALELSSSMQGLSDHSIAAFS
ncbi:MAG: hypothetical protein HQL94_10155, partial [Magnetococcales bacterium]|nr:hypothetical protein [Magnetococcales bacterium]